MAVLPSGSSQTFYSQAYKSAGRISYESNSRLSFKNGTKEQGPGHLAAAGFFSPGCGDSTEVAHKPGEIVCRPKNNSSRIPFESAKVTVDKKNSKKVFAEEEERRILLAENDRLMKQKLCRICKSNQVSALYLPCEHLVTCHQCSKSKPNCELCNTRVKKIIRVFV